MSWERRQRGGAYFYRSVRINGRPRKIYFGRGRGAQRQARLEAARRQRRQAEREALHAEQARVASADAALEDLCDMTDLLARATLLLAGFHEHHGLWRRRRLHDSTTHPEGS
jgi:hypothetical protein